MPRSNGRPSRACGSPLPAETAWNTPEAAAARFAALAGAGAQHVIVGILNIELPGVDVLAARLAELVHAIPTT